MKIIAHQIRIDNVIIGIKVGDDNNNNRIVGSDYEGASLSARSTGSALRDSIAAESRSTEMAGNDYTCGVSRFRAGVVVGEGQLRLVVVDVGGMMMMQMVRNRVFHAADRRVPASDACERVSGRQSAPLLPTAVGRADDGGQRALRPDRSQV